MVTPRLTRKEQQERTRQALIDAAVRVIADRGLPGASIDEIARAAGFTKGAFYANFANKDELLLKILDRHFDVALDDLDRAVAGNDQVADQARDAGLAFVAQMVAEPLWGRVFLELVGQATRDETFRRALLDRLERMRDGVATVLAARVDDLGVVPPLPPETIAQMTSAMACGVAIQRLIDPDGVPDDLFATMLVQLFAGLLSNAQPAA